MNSEYFRYILKIKKIKTNDLAKKLNITQSGLNYRILHSKFSIIEANKILNILNMKFEEVFKFDIV